MLKQAQREAGLPDDDYRDAIAAVSGMPDCRSSKDPRLADEHLDALMSYFEAIFWRKVGTTSTSSVTSKHRFFRARGYWANRNRKGHTSRDRFTESELTRDILVLEQRLMTLGCGLGYLQAIQNRIQPFSLVTYLAALRRTAAAKARKELEPF